MRGPNYWAINYQQLIVMRLDLEELEHRPTDQIEGFYDLLRQLLPSLYNHYCSEGHPGGFFERVKDGTWMGHVVEHIAIEIQSLAGMHCSFGQTRSTTQEGVYHVVFEYVVEEAGRYAAQAGVRIAEALIEGVDYPLEADLAALRRLYKDNFPGPSTHAILEEARRRNIPILTLSPHGLYQLGYGANQKRIRASMSSITSCIAVDLAGDKDETKHILREAGVPVPEGSLVSSQEELRETIDKIGYPLVIKPLDGHQGKGITIGIRSLEEASIALELAQEYSSSAVIERCISGMDFRVLVVNYQFVAASHRRAAAVTGDGASTIRQLIEVLNSDPRRGEGHESTLTTIKVDAITEAILEENKLTLDSVLETGQVLHLKKTANLSTGGTASDVTPEVHPDNIKLAERIARLIGLDICGIDITAPSLVTPIRTNGGAVLEVNAAPGLRMHLAPSDGEPRNVAAPIIDMLFPAGTPSRISLVAVTGTNGKTTVTRLMAHIAGTAGYHVGFTTTDGIYINGELLEPGDNTGPLSARIVLKEPDVNFAVLECARGGLLRAGLGFDQCDVGIVTNVASDHLGLGDIDTLEKMAKVKAVIPETVTPQGYAILNADDDLVYDMHQRIRSKVAYFSLDNLNHRIIDHCKRGGLAATIEGDMMVLKEGNHTLPIARVNEVPLTFEGTAPYMIQNVLAALLAAYVRAIDTVTIRKALMTFFPSADTTPGRMNLFQFKNFRFMVDYAHNPAALRALGTYLQRVTAYPKLGIVTGVGDRRDEDITELGLLAAEIFDEVVIRFDKDLRGRTADGIFQLLMQGIRQIDPNKTIRVFPTEEEAVVSVIRNAPPGSFIVHCTEKVDETLTLVSRLCTEEDFTSVYVHESMIPLEKGR